MRHVSPPLLPTLVVAALAACTASAPVGDSASSQTDGTPDSAADTDTGVGEDCSATVAPSLRGCIVTEWSDPDGNGRYPEVRRTQLDAEGRWVSRDYRNPNDEEDFSVCGATWHHSDAPGAEWCIGSSLYTYTWEYDANNHPTRKLYDAGNDGILDKSWTYTTDEAGDIIFEEQDEDVDGTLDATLRYHRDSERRVTREEWDYNADGVIDYARSYVYDPSGNLTVYGVDRDGDGILDERTNHTYAPDGRLLESSTDEDGDGTGDASAEYRYEDCRLAEQQTRSSDGVRGRTLYSWTPDGRLDRTGSDWNADGTIDSEAWYAYACPD